MALVVAGRIIPMDRNDPAAVLKGKVWLGDDGLIDAVTPAGTAGPSGFATAPVVDVGDGLVMPGIIDLHNHLGYNTLPLWTEPKQKQPFRHHNDWTDAPTYQSAITWPAWIMASAEPEALLAYVQARALVGGTTSLQGWPGANRATSVVVRNIDDEKAGTHNPNLIYTSVVTKNPLQLGEMAQSINRGVGFIYHCAEGQPGSVVAREFTDAANADCLHKTFIGIHCNAVAEADWKRWSASEGGAVVWSPFSNLWLYGSTTDIPAARSRGVSVCLGSDWGPSGTKHVLGELKVAKLVSQAKDFGLTDQDLVAMVTTNAGDVLERCWSRPVGRLVRGGCGDVTVLRARGTGKVWSQIVAATEREVMLVAVGSKPRYGDANVMTAAGAGAASTLTIRRSKRKLALANPADPNQAWTWTDIIDRLNAVRKDPAAALHKSEGRRRSFAGRLDSSAAPLELVLDMPTGSGHVLAARPPDPAKVVIPPLPTLVHDSAFFKTIHGRGFHGGLLDGLAASYR